MLHFFQIANGPRVFGKKGQTVFAKNPSPGISDLVIIPKHLPEIWVELKRPKGGVQSREQAAFQKACEDMGHLYTIWRSLDDAYEYLQNVGLQW